ncbi:MAG: PspA-associated protein PspAA [Actinopolymorphaceae bacterium]
MIVRILGEGQVKVADKHLEALNELDGRLESAVNAGDEDAFRAALQALLEKVRAVGTKLPDDSLEDSDLFLPPEDATVDEVKELLGEEGLIPG